MPRKKLSKREAARRKRRSSHNYHLRKAYGISIEEYDLLLAAQGGRCSICGGGTSKNHFAVDHNHKTGEIRGLCCARCNSGMAKFMDREENLIAALDHMRNGAKRVAKILGRKVNTNEIDGG